MQPDPSNRQTPTYAAAVAEKGDGFLIWSRSRRSGGCAGGTRGDPRGMEQQKVRGPRLVLEPSRLPEGIGPGRGGVRLRPPRPALYSLRRGCL
ncbi:unnamed protein product [Cuscuta europaea]|uniref:Uncharacterized protein n=1 Tax=Cuscuta europaea TaxID=41803 RepID=A0A9P0YHV9_CUSEU|nr:unnamed protein product [Cuscuta europaea]